MSTLLDAALGLLISYRQIVRQRILGVSLDRLASDISPQD
jgi:hypothetical protein